jgi:hypothetical protein
VIYPGGQEAPETGKRMRDDLYKKTMSADGISGRKPYGISTRMYNITGWKRIELNKMLGFYGITEANFASILRRSFVWKPKGRFLDPHYLARHYPDSALDGVFPKNPHLKQFLMSGPAVAAALQMQHGFETKYSQSECEFMIEEYCELGGDKNLTEDTMRLACGLALRDRRNDDGPGVGLADAPDSQNVTAAADSSLTVVAVAIMAQMVSENKEVYTRKAFKLFKLPPGTPNIDKDTIWTQLRADGLFTYGENIVGRSGKDAMRPVITPSIPFGTLVDIKCDNATNSFPETYNMKEFKQYMHGHPGRELNSQTMALHNKSVINSLQIKCKKTKGKPTMDFKITLEALRKTEEKHAATEELAKAIMEQHQTEWTLVKGRQTSFKSGSTTYRYTMDDLVRTRRQAIGFSAQGCVTRLLQHLCGHTYDLDIVNCMFTICIQLVVKLKLSPAMPLELFNILEKCAYQRTHICEDILNVDPDTGKQLLTSIMAGGGLSEEWSKNIFLQGVQKLSRYMRWMACSLLPAVYQKCVSDKDRKFPEAPMT